MPGAGIPGKVRSALHAGNLRLSFIARSSSAGSVAASPLHPARHNLNGSAPPGNHYPGITGPIIQRRDGRWLNQLSNNAGALYVAASRARLHTMLYAVTDDEMAETPPSQPIDCHQVLERVIAREVSNASAIEAIRRMQRHSAEKRETVSRETTRASL